MRMTGKPAHIPKFKKVRNLIEREVKKAAKKHLHDFAVELRGRLFSRIELQQFEDFKRIPLTDAWAKRKQRTGLDPRVMIATGYYHKSIRVIKHSDISFEVGLPEGKFAKNKTGANKKITLKHLAAIQEYGSASQGIPARAHWRIMLGEARAEAPKVAKKISDEVAATVNRKLA